MTTPERTNGPGSASRADRSAPISAPSATNGTGNRCRIRRHHVTSYVRVTAGQADKLLRDTVPRRSRERQTHRDYIVFASAVDKLAAAMVAAGIDVDDQPAVFR